jgi:outer membrane receptor protein involved in Fe transport
VLEGKISDGSDKDDLGLAGTSVYWAGSTTGSTTNAAGYFRIKRIRETDLLVVRFVGYETDTLKIEPGEEFLNHKLQPGKMLGEVVVTGQKSGTYINKFDPLFTMNITSAELCKAACCNLSESFETNASVDVNYSDASTGAKQIQLLGLAGIYTQVLAENIPAVHGLNNAYGLNFIPGPWMESIQVSKGASSVRNGYESIAGQINIEYKKPRESERIYANMFLSDAGREEVNANASLLLDKNWSTMLMIHSEIQNSRKDHNDDNFRDEPDIRQYHLFNRWDYITDRFTFRTGFSYLEESRIGGQYSYRMSDPDTWTNGFGINIKTRRFEGFSKIGSIFLPGKNMSLGWIQNMFYHEQNSYFGRVFYNGAQKAYFTNLLFQWKPGQGNHTLDAGLSYKHDLYDEKLDTESLVKEESVPGVFVQYTFNDSAKLTFVAGARADYHNLHGSLVTPRVHLRYVLSPPLILRVSAGKGFRSGNILAENSFLLASNRHIIISGNLKAEEAWNTGVSLTANIPLAGEILKVSTEAFRTNFINQVIVDMDADIHEARFYNLSGKSYSDVIQLETSYQFFNQLDILAAWRWNNVKMTIDGMLRIKPLTSRYKGLLTASWLTRLRKWQYDLTIQMNGPGRIPSTALNPEPYQRDTRFRAYPLINAQITRYFRDVQLYAGIENLTNFMQHDPIIAADDPFGNYFDSSMLWGPVHGRKIYFGIRFIKKREE